MAMEIQSNHFAHGSSITQFICNIYIINISIKYNQNDKKCVVL